MISSRKQVTRGMKFRYFGYVVAAGPVSEKRLKEEYNVGNCRLAVQMYFYDNHDLFLSKEKILLPEGYWNTGRFVKKGWMSSWEYFDGLETGDVIYAERVRNGDGELIKKTAGRSMIHTGRLVVIL